MSEDVPVYSELSSVYTGDDLVLARDRYAELAKKFKERFGEVPEVFARSPGRVNLIGEHIDYEGYAVFPMAIRQDTVVAIRRGGDALLVTNLNASKYPEKEFGKDPKQAVNVANHSWANYFLAAYKGVFEYLDGKGIEAPALSGLQILVDGHVPTGSGLSSSSAFVCACALAILGVHGISVPKGDVAEFTCTCERHVGTESGGMDQAISIMAKPGVAKLVEFNPIRGTDVELPPGATFVVSNSLTVSNKAETATERYNLRVVECRVAAMLMGLALGLTKEQASSLKTLQQLEELVKKSDPNNADLVSACINAVEKNLHDGYYTETEVNGKLGLELASLLSDSASWLKVLEKCRENEGLKLHSRAKHVFGEAKRVHDFKATCEGSMEVGEKLVKLGQLMSDSHKSCRDLYECSCLELEELVAVCEQCGSLGSRLTGAGWGGCTVSLVKDENVDSFIANVKSKFFSKRVESGQISSDDLDDVIFASKPSGGGAILKLQL